MLAGAVITACADEFAIDPPRTPSVRAQTAWPTTLSVRDTDTIGINIGDSIRQISISGVSVIWESSDPGILELRPLDTHSTIDPVLLPLRRQAITHRRGQVEVSATVDQAGFERRTFRDTLTVLERWVSLTSSAAYSCGITVDGDGYCWGSGQGLGNGSDAGSVAPSAILGGLKFSQLTAAHGYTCGITQPHGLPYCWGTSFYGTLGTGTTDAELIPQPVKGGRTFSEIVAGGRVTCAIPKGPGDGSSSDVNPLCWGAAWAGAAADPYKPAAVRGPVGQLEFPVVQVAAGWRHACAIQASGEAYCWGDNAFGQLGDGATPGPETCTSEDVQVQNIYGPTYSCSTRPVLVSGGVRFLSLTAGAHHTCGIAQDSTAYCWGGNEFAQLGAAIPIGSRSAQPVAVNGGLKFRSLSSAGEFRTVENRSAHTCGVTVSGRAYCWGSNSVGQLGAGGLSLAERCDFGVPCSSTPVPAADSLLRFVSVTTSGTGQSGTTRGRGHSCGVTTLGVVYCWGANSSGQLGNPSAGVLTAMPVRVVEPSP